MRKVNSTLGTKTSEGAKRRVKAGMHARIARGEHFGAPLKRLHPVIHSTCETCSKDFLWTRGTAMEGVKHRGSELSSGRFCSKSCLVKWLHLYRQILPKVETIKRLYWEEGLSLWDIARRFGVTDACTIRKAMEKGGIRRRAKFGSGKIFCIEAGCHEPTLKIRHTGNGSDYGLRCERHRKKHRKQLADDYYKQTRAKDSPIPTIIQAMLKGDQHVYAISSRTELSTKRIANTLRHMNEFGITEKVGTFRPRRHGGGLAILWQLTDEWKTKLPSYLT